ncbi:hypothetical protein R1sor_024037 [Riccia sorocarpa]|uniref:Translocon-associated protein subunit beta n=1 Tax=Riccia sorocarpa TaxID=122646 RepID=A0ABD3GQW5_9MARC
MASRGCFAVCAILLAVLGVAAAADTAFLIVHKTGDLVKGKGTEKITVSISLHNAGTSTAYDVSLNDDTWPGELFDIISGTPVQTWEKIDAGATLVHSFLLQAKAKGPFTSPPAVVKYRMAAKSALQEAYSTPLPEFDILSDKPATNRFDWGFGIQYGALILVLSVLGLFIAVLLSPSKSKKLSKAGKKRRSVSGLLLPSTEILEPVAVGWYCVNIWMRPRSEAFEDESD